MLCWIATRTRFFGSVEGLKVPFEGSKRPHLSHQLAYFADSLCQKAYKAGKIQLSVVNFQKLRFFTVFQSHRWLIEQA